MTNTIEASQNDKKTHSKHYILQIISWLLRTQTGEFHIYKENDIIREEDKRRKDTNEIEIFILQFFEIIHRRLAEREREIKDDIDCNSDNINDRIQNIKKI